MKCKIGFIVMSSSEFINHSFFLQQGKGISGNFEKSKLNPIPSKKDNSEVSFKHSFDKF